MSCGEEKRIVFAGMTRKNNTEIYTRKRFSGELDTRYLG